MFRYLIKKKTGERLYTDAHTVEEACQNLGINIDEVKRHMPIKFLDKPGMTEETKEKLAAIKAERKTLRRTNENARTNQKSRTARRGR